MSYYQKIWPFAKPYKKHAFGNVFFNVLYALFSTLSFIALIPVLKVIFDDKKEIVQKPVYQGITEVKDFLENSLNYFLTTSIEKHGNFTVLMYMIGVIVAIFLLKNLANYLALYYGTYLKNGMLNDLRNAMYTKITRLPLSYYSKTTKGDVISRVVADVNEMSNAYYALLEVMIREPLTIVFTLIAMFYLSFKLTLFVLVFIPISGYIISAIGKSLKKNAIYLQQEQSKLLSILEETLTGLRMVKSFTAEKAFGQKFEKTAGDFFHYSNKVNNRYNLASPLSEFLGILIIGVLLVFGGYLVFVEKNMEASFFLGYIMLAYNILTPAKGISRASYGLKRGNASAERVFHILEEENLITDVPNAQKKIEFSNQIELKNIKFQYEKEVVLQNFSLTIPKGKTVALVGPSGSGKSTIANLLTRFYDVQQGEIWLDGISIQQLKISSLRKMIALVSQESLLFNDTIENNLRLGKPNASLDELWKALEIANAKDFVSELPLGLQTNIGDAGGKLSGGQKQRISIARAVLKDAPILILDEATSALDTESERLVQDALEKIMVNRTSIVIAHRLSTIQKADVIVVMQKGTIAEQGNHESLLAHNGLYTKLVQMQSLESM